MDGGNDSKILFAHLLVAMDNNNITFIIERPQKFEDLPGILVDD